MNQEENTAAQAAQNQASDNIGAQQEVNNESAGKDCMPFTTENFHALLDANTAKQARLRTEYAKRLAYIQTVYDDDLDIFLALEHQANDKFHDARKAYEDAKEEYELDLRSLKKSRNEAGCRYNKDKASAKNFWAIENEKIQTERHNIFERYRNSGGALTGAEEGLLHPGWTRIKEGGVSDEEK